MSPCESAERVLVVLDGVKSLPPSEELRPLLKNRSTRIIIISYGSQPPETLRKEIDQQLIRGWSLINIQPLSTIHTTQRIVHSIMSRTHFTPLNREQKLLEKIAGLTAGCPGLIKSTNAILQRCLEEAEERMDGDYLNLFSLKIPMLSETRAELSSSGARSRSGSFKTNSYVSQLITAFQLPPAHEFVLRTLSVFSPLPIPLSVVDIVQSLVMKATQGSMDPGRGVPNSISNLLSTLLLQHYPSPVICPPSTQSTHTSSTPATSISKQTSFFCVPQLVQDSLWEDMEDTDIVFTITTAYKALLEFAHRAELSGSDLSFATGLAECIVAKCDSKKSCVDEGIYREAYRLLVDLQLKNI